ncbi:S8 family serine peptidase [Chryseolinea lacunae]|uniref:S8 family serine peptidase n=1 Tax=Chryseolinea lacunae TaxID=2801331 RepID=A0ABS1L4V9_9BACT|nr:S8 family serine peptidase [Chryseolinea lacunae]MBL0745596.1 S8 family serine peptidase [Chryseolinea lacunae]
MLTKLVTLIFVAAVAAPCMLLARGAPLRFLALAKKEISDETLAVTLRAAPHKVMAMRLTSRSASPVLRTKASGVLFLLKADANANATELLAYLMHSNIFEYVETDHVGHAAAVTQPVVFPLDPFFSRQWSHHNDGSFALSVATFDADADIAEAWTTTSGSAAVIVAVLDSGIKTDHREFDGRLWRNTHEIPDNQKDDDGNGYVDDVNGWNFVADNPAIEDDAGHGTHIAGIVGATGNNHVGYAGVDWHCKLMALKVLDEGLQGYYSDWVAAIYYAVDHGASIINLSVGGDAYSKALDDAVQYAWDRNVLIVASMQNLNNETVFYPAGHAHALAVGSTDANDHRSESFAGTLYGSNYGEHLDVVAPGNYIYGLYHLSDTVYSMVLSGTSQAAALVSGIASLLRAQHPDLTVEQLEQRIETTAEDGVGKETEDSPGWDRFYGYGRVNAALALHADGARPPVEHSLQIFPNPSGGLLRVVLDQKVALRFTLELCDSMGRLIFRDDHDATRRIELTYGFDELPPGLYLLYVRNENTRAVVKWLKY